MGQINESESIINYVVKEKKLSVKKILKEKMNISGRFLKKLEINKSILLNKKQVDLKDVAKKGDIITLIMENESLDYNPQNIPLDIIYEDYDLLIINKKPNIVVYPTKTEQDNTIANGVAYYFKNNNINKKIRFVNRLDMNTSGVLVVAKNPYGHQNMAFQFENNIVKKKYIAIVKGIVKQDKGIIDEPIGKDEDNPIRNIVKSGGKKAITKYKVLERYYDATLLEVNIETGRTHQIRVHLKHIGHPIIGDTLYSDGSHLINRQALHSYYLKFKVPRTRHWLEIKANLPDDIKKLIEELKGL